MSSFLWKYPTRGRPDLFKKRIKEWCHAIGSGEDGSEHHFLITIDEDDTTMHNEEMYGWISDWFDRTGNTITCGIIHGAGGTKIGACNDGVSGAMSGGVYDFVSLVSDDMIPQVENLHQRIADTILRHYPDGDGALHINDGLQGLNLCTFSCMGAKFFDRFDHFYHPDYISTHCDDEYTHKAWALRRMIWVPEVWVKHDWVGNSLGDELHKRNHNLMSRDAQVYKARAQAGFPAESVLQS